MTMTSLLAGGFVCIAFLIALAAAAYFRDFGRNRPVMMESVWFSLLALALLSFRFPFLRINLEMNPDESQMLAQAVRFSQDWLPWRSVDGTTGGPLNSYVLMWPIPFGIMPDYRTGRVTGLILILTAIYSLHVGLRQILGRAASLCLMLAPTLLYCLAIEPDLVHYSSEHVPLALCGMAFAFAVTALRKGSRVMFAVTGILLGALPFAKIQTVPIAAVAAAVISSGVIVERDTTPTCRIRKCGAFAGGLAFVPMLILVPVVTAGHWRDFWIRYIDFALNYGPAVSASRMATLYTLCVDGLTATPFFASALGGALLCLVCVPQFVRHGIRTGPLVAALVLGAASMFAVLKSNQPFPHYLHLLVVPSMLLLAAAYCAMTQVFHESQRSVRVLTALLVVWLVLPQLGAYAARGLPHKFYADWYAADTPRNHVAEFVRRNRRDGDSLEVWGWVPSFYVMSQTMCATRDSIGHAVLLKSPHSHYYLATHVSDLRESMPAFFIDAVTEVSHCPEWPPVSEVRATVTPMVKDFLEEHYTSVGQAAQGGAATPLRVYVRNDRLADFNKP
jgi:hypothetical protein